MNYSIINLSELYNTLGDNTAIKVKMLTTIGKETTSGLEQLAIAHSKKDLEETRYYVHKMKAAAGYLGMKETGKTMGDVEKEIHAGATYESIRERVVQVMEVFQLALKEVDGELKILVY